MSKIKDTLDKIRGQWAPYHDLKLLVAKRVWMLIASLYFLATLFTVGGFYFSGLSISALSTLTFHLYSVLVIATGWMIYELGEYAVVVHAPTKRWLIAFPILLALALVTLALLTHLSII